LPVSWTGILDHVVAEPWIYSQIQKVFGLEWRKQRLEPYLAETNYKVILDVGAGTGLYRSLISKTARYIALDIDPKKLSRVSDAIRLIGDAAHLSFKKYKRRFSFVYRHFSPFK
jgi:ubiquinone/menaquinone biosynthesis C-methylase UbiE